MNASFRNLVPCLTLLAGLCLLSSCGTIIGGSKYYAHVRVKDHPDATIYYNGFPQGSGNGAYFLAKRSKANQFIMTIKEKGCSDQTVSFHGRKFRWGAFLGSFSLTLETDDGVILPIPLFIDIVAGALWKPDIREPGITKVDFKTYFYLIDLPACESTAQSSLSNPETPTGSAFILNAESNETPVFESHTERNSFIQ